MLLVDPSRADPEAHTTLLFGDDEVGKILAQSSYANSFSPIPAHRCPRPISTTPPNPYSSRSLVLHRSIAVPLPAMSQGTSQARMALLQSFLNITRATKHAAQNILPHPLAKPIVSHPPDPMKGLVNANEEWEWGSWVEKGGVGEFESARVYLARWAQKSAPFISESIISLPVYGRHEMGLWVGDGGSVPFLFPQLIPFLPRGVPLVHSQKERPHGPPQIPNCAYTSPEHLLSHFPLAYFGPTGIIKPGQPHLRIDGVFGVPSSFRSGEVRGVNKGALGFSNGHKHQVLPMPIMELPVKPGDMEKFVLRTTT